MVPSITDWLMVIITFIYVVATCAICFFNWRSANVAQKQIEENQKQYEDEKKYRVLPWFHVSISKFEINESSHPNPGEVIYVYMCSTDASIHSPLYCMEFCVRNIGQGPATRFKYDWICPDGADSFPVFFANQSLMPGEDFSKTVFAKFSISDLTSNKSNYGIILTEAKMKFTFYDIYNREYSQIIAVHFKINEKEHTIEAEIEAGMPKTVDRK